jgi:hypothetical protein
MRHLLPTQHTGQVPRDARLGWRWAPAARWLAAIDRPVPFATQYCGKVHQSGGTS